jgi:acylphosphatase
VLVRITGRVQGVWFRGWTVDEATRLRLSGWVRNRRDGAVEALFSGPAQAVDQMVAACRRGPPAASVDDVAINPADPPAESGFRQLPTV